MPTKWTGTVDERIARLDKAGRRCDGNSRHCTRSAVEEYTLLRADGFGNALPDAEPEDKKCCSYHRAQFLDNGLWKVVANRELSKKLPTKPQPYNPAREGRNRQNPAA